MRSAVPARYFCNSPMSWWPQPTKPSKKSMKQCKISMPLPPNLTLKARILSENQITWRICLPASLKNCKTLPKRRTAKLPNLKNAISASKLKTSSKTPVMWLKNLKPWPLIWTGFLPPTPKKNCGKNIMPAIRQLLSAICRAIWTNSRFCKFAPSLRKILNSAIW